MSDNIAEINNVTKFFNKNNNPALKNISINLSSGMVTGLVGPDGAGKTTLIRLITGLLIPDSGEIQVSGFSTVSQSQNITRIVGYMPQKFGLYEDLSVIENLQLYADLRGVTGNEKKEAFERLLAFTDLKKFTTRLAGNLSGGMKQKLGLACSLLGKPKLLLLDEPSVGVDPISRRELWNMVRKLADDGMVVLWSTSYLDEAENCDKVILLNEGEMLFNGSPEELTNRISGRVFQIQNIKDKNRVILRKILKEKGVIDGVVQGKSVRIVLDNEHNLPDLAKFDPEKKAQLVMVKPRFEDSFIEILGGGPGGDSRLANTMRAFNDENRIVIEASNLTKKYGDFTAANEISFSIKRGEIFGLLGPNGAGKSTTFKMMCGLIQPTYGTAKIMDIDLSISPSKARSHIGYMAQKFSLYSDLSVLRNLKFFSGVYGLKGRKQKEKIKQMIEVFNLKKYLDDAAGELPLGYKQRLSLACAVMHEPPVLFLDEPTSGVDPITRREFWTHINNMVEKGVTVMVTTHFMDEAEYCDRISLIYRGQSIATETPDSLKDSIQSNNLSEPTMEDAFIEIIKNFDAQTSKEIA